VAAFELDLEANLWQLHEELRTQTYRPSPCHNFIVQERKRRLISAAPFRDRVVHHALCNVTQPIFERRFIYRRRRYVLQCDAEQFFPSIDHQILRSFLTHRIADERVLWLIDLILASGAGVLTGEYRITTIYLL